MKHKLKYYSFLTLLLISLAVRTSYAQDSVFLNKNQAAPFPGYLLPAGKVEELQNDVIELNTLKQTNDSLQKSLTLEQQDSALKDQKVNLLLDQNNKLASAAYTERELTVWEKVAYFAGGVIVTGLAVWGASSIINK
jgi:hypothetical protein